MSSYAKSDGARAPIGEGHAPSSSHRTSTPALNGSGVQRSRSQRMTSSGTSASRPAMVRPGSSHQHQSAHRASTGDGAFSTLKPHKSLGDGAAPVESGRFPSVVVPQLSDRFEAEREHLTRASEMPFGPETSDVGLKPPSISSSSSKPSRTASIFRLGRGLRNKSKPSTSAGDSSDAPKEGSASPSARASSSTRSGNSSRSISAVTSAVENTGSSEPRLSISSSRHSGSSPSDGRASSDLDHMLRSGRFASSSSLVAAPSKLKMPQDPEEDGENFAEQIELIHHPGQALVAGSHAVYDSIAGVPSRRHLGSDADQESASAQDDVASAKKGSYVDGSILAEGLGTAKRQHRAVPSIDSNPESTSHGRRRSLALFSMPKQSSSVAGEPDASWEVSQEQSRNRQSANQSASIVDAERTITGRVHAPSIAVASPSSNDYPATSPRILGSFSRRTGVAPPQLPPPAIAPPALPSELARTPNKARQVSAPASTPSRMANLFKSKLMGPRDRVGDEDEGHAAVASLPASSALVGLGTFVMPTRDHEAEERHVEGRRLRKTRSQVNLQGSKASHNSSSRERAIGAGGRDEGQSGSSKGKSTDRSADSARPNHRRPRTSGAADASSRLAPSIAIDGAHETLTASPMDSPTLSSKAWVADERFKAAKEASRAKSGWEMTSSSRLELLDSSPEEEKRQYFPPISPPDSNAPGRRRSFVQRQAPPWRLARANSSTAGVDDYPSGAVNVSRRSSVARPSSAKTLDGAGPSIAAPIGSSAGTSRLDHSGGASALFGGSSASATPRQRASSLIPSLPWTRSRTSSSVALEGRPSLPSGDGRGHSTQQVLNSVASAIAAKDSLQQDAMRRTSIALEHLRSADSDPASTSLQSSTTHVDKYEKPSKASQDSGAREFDSPETFVEHVVASVPRNDVVAVLASKTDDLHKHALQLFMRRFLFAGHPLDIALRKLLMSLCLPKETQQIDRVMEAFAQRYNECNENLFAAQGESQRIGGVLPCVLTPRLASINLS
ncbi:hypothetical protein IE81DRAFT_148360 [Ceraceosorus guamensis]|uniref:SEC7 domain-containing protein n=1 Tax=Ceraceosorus guamensis TaxID=1522189 RepID=A0A316W067_9BASI|nr:hypothetical protein IE81DRAFT_148360 [Ceraceosorus guamensis]PWN41951.1 hypothetical protein IE81DRAFT_148360 [Ceraceosorus guamensis]